MSARSRARDLESKALLAEKHATSASASNSNGTALDAAISSAELYMQALKLADNPSDRSRLDAKCRALLLRAEAIKTKQSGNSLNGKPTIRGDLQQPKSQRKLTTRENIILLEGSKLNGAIFKPWTTNPSAQDFQMIGDTAMFTDDLVMSLSEAQLKSFASWERPKKALSLIRLENDSVVLPNEPTMTMTGRIDLVQDITSDCSVVASLCVGTARAERGHPKILGSIVHPYDFIKDQIDTSPNGKYILRLFFNGCWRRVEIDDLLPTSKTSRVLHVINRSCPGLLWPALVEKAYLKVRGGYDFPGSNSGTDLAVLTGWIPQQIFLHDDEVEGNGLWEDLYSSFSVGDVLLTLGTGKLSRREQKQLGLGAEHDYAVLDMKDENGVRELLVKNPWADGDIWKGAVRRRPNPNHEVDGGGNKDLEPEIENKSMLPGTFWMDFNSVFQYFENMYINWNPGYFTHRQDFHFSWHIPATQQIPNVFIDNPQFTITSSKAGEVWVLLNRHFRTGDYTIANQGKNGYISLYLYDNQGNRVFSSESAKIRGPFVDSPNTLLRLETKSNQAITVVVVSQDLPAGKHNFTLSAFSKCPIDLQEARDRYVQKHSLQAAWTRTTAGGNSDSPRYFQNPQFKINLTADLDIALVLRLVEDPAKALQDTNIHVKLLIAASDGSRVTKLRPRDTVAHSGDYRRGSSVVETSLSKGTCTVICSTFDQQQLAGFQLDLYTSLNQQASFAPIPSENSGRLNILSEPAIFVGEMNKASAQLRISRMTRAIFIVRALRGANNVLYKLSLEQGQGPYRICIATSSNDTADFGSITSGLRIEDTDLNAAMQDPANGGLWLTLERPPQSSSKAELTQALQVEILSEERVSLSAWRMYEE